MAVEVGGGEWGRVVISQVDPLRMAVPISPVIVRVPCLRPVLDLPNL